jgi:hypothetical protein
MTGRPDRRGVEDRRCHPNKGMEAPTHEAHTRVSKHAGGPFVPELGKIHALPPSPTRQRGALSGGGYARSVIKVTTRGRGSETLSCKDGEVRAPLPRNWRFSKRAGPRESQTGCVLHHRGGAYRDRVLASPTAPAQCRTGRGLFPSSPFSTFRVCETPGDFVPCFVELRSRSPSDASLAWLIKSAKRAVEGGKSKPRTSPVAFDGSKTPRSPIIPSCPGGPARPWPG